MMSRNKPDREIYVIKVYDTYGKDTTVSPSLRFLLHIGQGHFFMEPGFRPPLSDHRRKMNNVDEFRGVKLQSKK